MSLISWLENSMVSCPFKKNFGLDCFGCGMQRSLVALLKGEFLESLYFYPALIPLLLMLVFLTAHLRFKFKNGGKWLKYQFIIVVAIIVLNFIAKLI